MPLVAPSTEGHPAAPPSPGVEPGETAPAGRRRWRVLLVIGTLVAVAGALAWHRLGREAADGVPRVRTIPVVRGDLLVTISATGTIEPEEVVDVGAQVVGMIR